MAQPAAQKKKTTTPTRQTKTRSEWRSRRAKCAPKIELAQLINLPNLVWPTLERCQEPFNHPSPPAYAFVHVWACHLLVHICLGCCCGCCGWCCWCSHVIGISLAISFTLFCSLSPSVCRQVLTTACTCRRRCLLVYWLSVSWQWHNPHLHSQCSRSPSPSSSQLFLFFWPNFEHSLWLNCFLAAHVGSSKQPD